jgi:hypothetical protein
VTGESTSARDLGEVVKEHGAGVGDVQGIYPRRSCHGDGQALVAQALGRRIEPRALWTEENRDSLRRGETGQRLGVVGKNGSEQRETGRLPQREQVIGPARGAHDRQREDRTGGGANRLPVERIRAARGEQDGIGTEGRCVARDAAQVVDVDQIHKHHHRARVGRNAG